MIMMAFINTLQGCKTDDIQLLLSERRWDSNIEMYLYTLPAHMSLSCEASPVTYEMMCTNAAKLGEREMP